VNGSHFGLVVQNGRNAMMSACAGGNVQLVRWLVDICGCSVLDCDYVSQLD
jgi:hypothetical protein